MQRDGYTFHGGCAGCTNDLDVCASCQYMEPDWTLPDLNTAHKEGRELKEAMKKVAYALQAIKRGD